MFMMRRFLKDRNGASEIVGTALFLVILFFFFTNVFLWHDQVTREMDQVVVDRMNSGVRVEAFFDDTAVWLMVDNVGGLDVALSRLWIITDDAHLFADFESKDIHVAAGCHRNVTLSGVTVFVGEDEVRVRVDGGGSVFVDYAPSSGVTVVFRVLTKRANTAACSLTL
jgi:hypothetical protein